MAVTIAKYTPVAGGAYEDYGPIVAYFEDTSVLPRVIILTFPNTTNQMSGGYLGITPLYIADDAVVTPATDIKAALDVVADFTPAAYADIAALEADCPQMGQFVRFALLAGLVV